MARTALELRGVACLKLEDISPPKQQIIASRAFGHKITDLTSIEQAVAHHVARAALRLRQQQSAAGAMQIFIHTNPFSTTDARYSRSAVITFGAPTADIARLTRQALAALTTIY